MSRKLVALCAGIAVTAASASGCSQVVPGAAEAATPGRTAPPPAGQDKARELTGIDPCGLLTAQESAQFGSSTHERQDYGGAHICQWSFPGSHALDLGLDDQRGVKQLIVGEGRPSTITVGRHQARQIAANFGDGNCVVSLAITDSSRVDVVANANVDTAKACDLALRTAKIVEPKVP
ncbi:hypothetical protein GCM10010174_36280 [Kutzneria viridogrisea]|uniref:DUF3558 domain-containing protein n=2 Tax=Kutzneria TaxID=43356 RepID=A0ABR6BLQ9_9PSEU|nr:DUF3558 family protein [Kutzneria albida]AHH94818.1 putative secreted protein [Kutzneria albida DSM 43870]MBA8927838.1 hypothetical protein [Kutzneria viridogrisea]